MDLDHYCLYPLVLGCESHVLVRCPACQQEYAVSLEQLGSEFICPSPGCGLRMRLNPLTIQLFGKTRSPLWRLEK